MRIKAYPKINLCLKVYKDLEESKHKVDTIMFKYTKLYDTIIIKKSHQLSVIYKEGSKYLSLDDCLITKSLKYLKKKYGFNINYKIKVIKRIPFGSGLGGGSADAAAVINFVTKQQKNQLLDLKEIAVELGSDIPFLLSGYDMARVKDLGQYVTPIYNWKPKVNLIFTKTYCSTKKVFQSLQQDKDYQSTVKVNLIINKYLYKQHYRNVVYNDLTKYIIQNYKELQPVYNSITTTKFFTGSGGTIVTLKE